MVRRKSTNRLPGTGPPLGHLANLPGEIVEEVETQPKRIIEGQKCSKSKQPLPEELRTPTPRGDIHLDARKRGTRYVKHERGSLPGVVIQDGVNRDNVDDIIQRVNKEIVEEIGIEEHNQVGEDEPAQGEGNEGGDYNVIEQVNEEIVEEIGTQEHNQGGEDEPAQGDGNGGGDDEDGDDEEEGDKNGDKDDDESEEDLDEEEQEEIVDHQNAVRVLKRQKNKVWKIENECDEVRLAVFNCVLWNGIQHAHQKFDVVTVSAFAERIASDDEVEDADVIHFSAVAGYNGPLFYPGGFGEVEDTYDEPNAADDGYLEWYEHISHPRVINNVQQARANKAKVTTMEKEAKKATPKCGDEALTLWNSAVKAGAKLLKKMMAKIRSGELMDTRQQTDLYNQWTNVFNPDLVDTSQVDPSQTMPSKRSQREGEGSSRMVQQQSSGDDTPSDEGRPIAPKRKSRKVSRSGRDK
ncbi:uncharacterized protein LOC113358885 [Papaver somniferum]|uniref:uncharacterized protein LOC113358885 n=1 Tax=Papaver somniferum TaxID=3469 RepID=UPI000E6FC678|nr:uncharacterized protein LOC113358885 [Papaver somniferum]